MIAADLTEILPKIRSYRNRSLERITHIVLHHSGTPNGTSFQFARYHTQKGWPGIGYHFVIHPNGDIDKTQELSKLSYHTRGHNTKSIGICLIGNFNAAEPPKEQIATLEELLGSLQLVLGEKEVVGHRHFVATDCPGKLWHFDY